MPEGYPQITLQNNDTLVVKTITPAGLQQPAINLQRREIDTSLLQKLNQLSVREQVNRHLQTQRKARDKSSGLKLLTPKTSKLTVKSNTQAHTAYTSQLDNGLVLPHRKHEGCKNDWITIVFVLALIILASIRVLFKKYFEQLFSAIINPITANRLFRESNFNILHASSRLDLFAYIMMAFLGYQVALYFDVWPTLNGLWLWGGCMLAVMLYFIFKFAFYRALGGLSQEKTVTAEYIFNIKLHTKVLGIALFPLVVINTYVPADLLKSFIIVGIVIVIGFYLLSLFRGILIFMHKQFSVFYLILYLCTLEILPLILIFKIFVSEGSIVKY